MIRLFLLKGVQLTEAPHSSLKWALSRHTHHWGQASLLHIPPKLYPEPQGRWVEICEMRLPSPSFAHANGRELHIAVPAVKGRHGTRGGHIQELFLPSPGPQGSPFRDISSTVASGTVWHEVSSPHCSQHASLQAWPFFPHFCSVEQNPRWLGLCYSLVHTSSSRKTQGQPATCLPSFITPRG